MTIRELLVKVQALVDGDSFKRAQQAADAVKQSLQKVADQNRQLPGTFAAVRLACRGIAEDFSALTQTIEKNRMVFAGVGVALGALLTKTSQIALDFERVEHQIRRIAGTEENFQRLSQAVAQLREETGAFTTREILQSVRYAADETGLALERIIELLPAVGKIAAAQGDTIAETFMKLRTVAVTGTIRQNLASILGQEETVRLRQRFHEIDKAARALNLTIEEVTEQKFDLLVASVQQAAQKIQKPVSDSQSAFVQFRQAMDDLHIALGQRILPTVTNALKVLTGFVEAINRAPAVVKTLADAVLFLGGAATGVTAFSMAVQVLRAVFSTARALTPTLQNLGVRVAMVLEAMGATGAADRLLNVLIALQHPVATLRSAFTGLGAAIVRLGKAFMAAFAPAGGIRGIFAGLAASGRALSGVLGGLAVAARGIGTAVAAFGRGLLATLGPIGAVYLAVQGLIWLIEKLWDKLSGRERAKEAAKAFRERAVTILEKSQREITARLQALSEEQRRQIEEAFTKLPVELQLAAQELGAEEFVKLNINAEPIRALVSEIRKGRIEGEKLVTELSKIIGRSKEVIGVAQAQKETLSAVVEQYRRGLIEVDKSKIVFDRAVHGRVLKALRELQAPDVLWQAYSNLPTEMAALVQQRFVREGTGWIKELAEKMRAEKPTLRKAIEELMQAVAEYIPQSPAKRGPLSRIHTVGAAFASTVARSLVQARPIIDAALRKTIPEIHTVAVSLSPELEAIPEAVQRVRRIVQPVKGVPARLVQTVRRVVDEVPELSSMVVQRVVRIADELPELPEAVQRVRLVPGVVAQPLVRPALAVAGIGALPAMNFMPSISVNVTIAEADRGRPSGLRERELATEIATQTGYQLWKQIRPHWEAAMLQIFRSFKRHEAPDIKGQMP